MAKVTITAEDNPLGGQPGQPDVTLVISSEPDMPLKPNGDPDVEAITAAQAAAVAAVAHIAGIAYSTAFVHVAKPTRGGNN